MANDKDLTEKDLAELYCKIKKEYICIHKDKLAEKDAKIEELSNSAQFRRVEQQQKRIEELEKELKAAYENPGDLI